LNTIAELGTFAITTGVTPLNSELSGFEDCYKILNTKTGMLEYETLHLFAAYKYIYDATLQEAGWKKAFNDMEAEKSGIMLPDASVVVPGPHGPQ
jgi:hypothetical protein